MLEQNYIIYKVNQNGLFSKVCNSYSWQSLIIRKGVPLKTVQFLDYLELDWRFEYLHILCKVQWNNKTITVSYNVQFCSTQYVLVRIANADYEYLPDII